MTKQTLQRKINLGAKWLDEVKPNWWKKIDLELLDMSHPSYCILGQLYNDFYNTLSLDRKYMGKRKTKYTMNYEEVVDRGLAISNGKGGEYELLASLWKSKIQRLIKNLSTV